MKKIINNKTVLISAGSESGIVKLPKGITVTKEITKNDLPIYSKDQDEIKINSILYRTQYSSGNYFKGESKMGIEVLRVIHISLIKREFRTRCAKGCEYTYSVNGTCSGLYSKLISAKKHLKDSSVHDLQRCERKRLSVLKTKEAINKEKKRIFKLKEFSFVVPKPVSV